MTELLSAGFYRLRRSWLLWIVCLALVLASAGYVVWSWHDIQVSYPDIDDDEVREIRLALRGEHMDSVVFTVAGMTAVMLSPALCAWELGAEYQDGALRCKLSVGHRRSGVYLTSLLFTTLICVLLCLSVFLPGALATVLAAGGFAMGWSKALLTMAGVTAASAALAALFTLLCLNIQNRAASAIAAIGLTLALALGGSLLSSRLMEEPTFHGYETTADGRFIPTEVPNPRYIPEGPLRDILTALNDLDPAGQAVRYTHSDWPVDPVPLMASDAAFFALATAAGLLIFRRKDLR